MALVSRWPVLTFRSQCQSSMSQITLIHIKQVLIIVRFADRLMTLLNASRMAKNYVLCLYNNVHGHAPEKRTWDLQIP